MAKHRTPLKLSDDERTFLFDFTREGLRPAREIKRALVLPDSTDPTLDNSTLAQRFGVSRATVENVQRYYRRGGLEQALHEAPRSGQPKEDHPTQRSLHHRHCLLEAACRTGSLDDADDCRPPG